MSIEAGGPSPEEMGIERNEQVETPPVVLTQEERSLLLTGLENPDVQKLIEEKEIIPNSGDLKVVVDGIEAVISTDPDDFGTRIVPFPPNRA